MTTVYIAVWNSTLSTGSFKWKQAAYAKWMTWFKQFAPGLVVLLEASETMAVDDAGYAVVGHVDTQSVKGGIDAPPIAKSIVALWNAGNAAYPTQPKGTALRFPGLDDATRATLKISLLGGDGARASLWFIHANASKKGGKAMVDAVAEEVGKDANTAVFGDFNLTFEDAAAAVANQNLVAVQPISHQQQTLPFTNWNLKGTRFPNQSELAKWGVAGSINLTINPGSILDYTLAGTKLNVTAQPNTQDGNMLREILSQFDHYPVVYRVQW